MDSGPSLVRLLATLSKEVDPSSPAWTDCLCCVSFLHTAWLQIIAAAQETIPGAGINDVLQDFYKKYGRSFFSR